MASFRRLLSAARAVPAGFLLFLLAAGPAAPRPASAAKGPAKFGHFPYDAAPEADLVFVGEYRQSGRRVKMRRAAADAFRRMQEAAKAEGVEIIPISGFRTVEYQKNLFERSRKRRGSEQAAAKWVAPPGHSEHHTGWTLDLGDAKRRDTDVDQSFENTDAFRWLTKNAARFDFEISFPKNNAQGVSYEPWHWRFIGAEEARSAFHGKDR